MKAIAHLSYFFSNKESRTIGLLFTFNSFVFGHWVTRIPDIKQALNLSEGDLGIALLGGPIGAISMLPFVGWFISRLGLGKATWFASFLHLSSPVLMVLAGSKIELLLALVYFGATNALMDVAMNSAASKNEKETGRTVMSTCHGMWSLGAMLGAASGAIVLSFEIPYVNHLLIICLLTLVIYFSFTNIIWNLRVIAGQASHKLFALPNRTLLGLAVIGFCVLLSEGAIADWSALFMQDAIAAAPVYVGLAYACYSMAMAIGRLMGDAIIPRYGKKTVALWGGVLSAFGLIILITLPFPIISLIGFSLTGLGYSCIVPIIFSLAANEPGYSAGTGIAAVTTISYTGFLIGPPLIGLLAEVTSLTAAFGILLVLALLIVFLSRMIHSR